ncbi:hypothetical protein [Qipengyuania marisflavi]|uniref:Uncharacterized protein n=1 Tax=Qipengyuania marisflavi TaxID=2486356 RepID=A0A5S3P3R5_9SPHN|nr:hypothetical protein [Qipengyuania marisflavi]TMM46671.1 hypothetical protein FEV51_10575 [Qipengyuania marisflavi]
MTNASSAALPFRLRSIALWIIPPTAILLARWMTHSDWAAANAALAAGLFLWVAADGLLLPLMARAPQHKPAPYAVLGALALAGIIVIFGAAPPVRHVVLGWPPLLTALALTIAVWLGWSGLRIAAEYRRSQSLERALGAVLPPLLVRFHCNELRAMRLALFVWRAPPEVPAGAQGFACHRYLTPMLATLLTLQLIELVVVHFLVMLWNPSVAYVLLALSVGGVLWLIALLKSFRLYPVLIDDAGVQVRLGMLVDAFIPHDAIGEIGGAFTADQVKDRRTLNTAILGYPNLFVRLTRPVQFQNSFGLWREINAVALRLDEPAAFTAALAGKHG